MRNLAVGLALLALACGDAAGPGTGLSVAGSWHCADHTFSEGQPWTAHLEDRDGQVSGTVLMLFDDDEWTCDVRDGLRTLAPAGTEPTTWMEATVLCVSEAEGRGFSFEWRTDVHGAGGRAHTLTGHLGHFDVTMVRAEGEPPACD